LDVGAPTRVPEPELERQGRRFGKPASWFLALAAILEVPGILLFVLGHSWVAAIGIGLIALGIPPATVGVGLLVSALVARWAARHKPFA
jgi:hypothetical protein